jgi:hypothetical protein
MGGGLALASTEVRYSSSVRMRALSAVVNARASFVGSELVTFAPMLVQKARIETRAVTDHSR